MSTSFCPGCFRMVSNKGFLNILCQECQLKETIKKEADKTRRLMEQQEKNKAKQEKIRSHNSLESAHQSEPDIAILGLLPVNHEEIKYFNKEAEKYVNSQNISALERLFETAKWSLSDLVLSRSTIHELTVQTSSPHQQQLLKLFKNSLSEHIYIRHLMSLYLLQRKNGPDIFEWVSVSHGLFEKNHDYIKVLLKSLSLQDTQTARMFSEKYRWFDLTTSELDEALEAICKNKDFYLACRTLIEIIIRKNLVKTLKKPKSITRVLEHAAELQDVKSVLLGLTLIASQDKKIAKQIYKADLLAYFQKVEVEEKFTPNELNHRVTLFFEDWESCCNCDDVSNYIREQKTKIFSYVQSKIESANNDFDNQINKAFNDYQEIRKKEAEKLRETCKGFNKILFSYENYGYRILYRDIARATDEKLYDLFDEVREERRRTMIFTKVFSVDFGPSEAPTIHYFWYALIGALFGTFFILLSDLKNPIGTLLVGSPGAICYYYSLKCLFVLYSKVCLHNMQDHFKLENMRFETNAYENKLKDLREAKTQEPDRVTQTRKVA